MRPIILLALISMACAAHSADNETTAKKKVTHHVQFLFGNYVSTSFTGKVYNPNVFPTSTLSDFSYMGALSNTNTRPIFAPLYGYSIGFDYTAEFSASIGLRTGINYYTGGYIVSANGNYWSDSWEINERIFISSLNIPVHLMVYKDLAKGRIVFSVGPDIYLPSNAFGQGKTYYPGDPSAPTYKYHFLVRPGQFLFDGSLGFTAGIGYEKKISNKLAVEFMPDFHVMNIVPFNLQGERSHIYQNYVFNIAAGLSTYFTFY